MLPSPPVPPPLPFSNFESERSLRKTHLSHETSLRSVGFLYCLGGVILLGIGALTFAGNDHRPLAVKIALCVFLFSTAVAQFWTGIGLRRLQAWARTPTGILSGIGLFGFPIGTLINAYVLYLVFSKKGTMIFSEQYKGVMAATPDIKYKTSIIVWAFLGLLIAVLLMIALAAFFSH